MVFRFVAALLALSLLAFGHGGSHEPAGGGAALTATEVPALISLGADSGDALGERLGDNPSQPQLDPSSEGTALLPTVPAMASAVTTQVPCTFVSTPPRTPYLEGPLRPPRSQAVLA